MLSRAGEDPGDIGGLRALPRRQVMLTMAAVMLAMFLSPMDQTIMGTAMPCIITEYRKVYNNAIAEACNACLI